MSFGVLAGCVQVELSVLRVSQNVIVVHVLQFGGSFVLHGGQSLIPILIFLVIICSFSINEGREAFWGQAFHVNALDADNFLLNPAVLGTPAKHVPVRVELLVNDDLRDLRDTGRFVKIQLAPDFRLNEFSNEGPN